MVADSTAVSTANLKGIDRVREPQGREKAAVSTANLKGIDRGDQENYLPSQQGLYFLNKKI